MGHNLDRQGDPLALVLDRFDTVIRLLEMSIARPPEQGVQGFALMAPLMEQQNKLLEIMLAASLPSTPLNVLTITVGTTEILLAENESTPLMRVDVHNLNVAQPLLVSNRGVSPTSGMQILARTTRSFVLPAGSKLYGIVNLGTILITVSFGYDIQGLLESILRPQS